MLYIFSKQKLYKEMYFNNFYIEIIINRNRILWFEIIALSEGNTNIVLPNLEVLPFEFLGR